METLHEVGPLARASLDGSGALGEQREQRRDVDRLDEVVIDSGLGAAFEVGRLPEAGHRHEQRLGRRASVQTARDLQARLQPKVLANEAWEKAKMKGADLAEDAVDAVAKRPVAVGGVVAALAMFLARDPLKKATVKFYDAMTPLFEPRSKAVALKEKKAATPARRPAAKRPARAPRRPAQRKTEKA